MSKIKMAVLGAIVTLLAAVGVQAATLTAAHAASYSSTNCIKYNASGPSDGVKTCLRVAWRSQNDGTGVVFEAIEVTTEYGCGTLHDWPYGPENYTKWINPRTDNVQNAWDWGYEATCNYTHNGMSDAGTDTGAMHVTHGMKARSQITLDDWLFWRIRVEPDGGREWLESWHEECAEVAMC